MEFSTLAEIDATELFEDDNVNWQWCVKNAQFTHREACEFIVHVGSSPNTEGSIFQCILDEMREGGCREDFIQAYIAAKDAGAVRVLFYA